MRAYAVLLKRHRPDQDPEGFRRLHDAYQQVLRRAADEAQDERPAQDPVPVASPPLRMEEPAVVVAQVNASTAPIEPVSSPWDRACAAVDEAAVLPPGPQRWTALVTSLRLAVGAAHASRRSVQDLLDLLDRHLPEGRDTWHTVLRDDELFADLRAGGNDLTLFTLRGSFAASDWPRLQGFARRWLEEGEALVDPDALFGITRVLAIWLAVVDYELAQRLLQRFPAPALRMADEELDQVMSLGLQARALPEAARHYVCDLIRGKALDERATVQARGWLLAHLPNIPAETLLGRLLHQRFPGYQVRRNTTGQTEVPMDLLSLSITALAVTVLVFAIIALMAIAPSDPWPAIITIALLIILIGGGVFAYRRLAPWYFRVARPWLWARIGPFDAPCCLLMVWSALAVAVPALIGWEASGAVWLLVGCVFLPVGLLLIHWGRQVLDVVMEGVPAWNGSGQRLRAALVGDGQFGGDLTWTGFVRAVRATWAGLPAMLAAGVLIIGLSTCPAWPEWYWMVAFNFWVAPWVVASVVIHAVLIQWRHDHGPWWRPLGVLAWCCWLPGAAWLATMLLVWTGHAGEPASATVGITAVVVAALLPGIISRRVRRT